MSGETSLGGGARRFPETTWSLVARLGPDGDGRSALEALIARYWKPVYCYVRVAWGKSNADAKDLTQAFFSWIFEDLPLTAFDPDRGSFRAFLKTLLRRFVGHRERALQRLKRGGGIRHVPLPETDLPDPRGHDPETVFDRAWISQVVERALEQLTETCERKERPVAREIYERFEFAPEGERPQYQQLASELSLPASEVKNHLFWAREQVRGAIRAELRETTADNEGLEAEWRVLFGS